MFHPTSLTYETSIPLYFFKASTVMTSSSHCATLSKIKTPQIAQTGLFSKGFFIAESVLTIFPYGFSPLLILLPHPMYKLLLLPLRLKNSPKNPPLGDHDTPYQLLKNRSRVGVLWVSYHSTAVLIDTPPFIKPLTSHVNRRNDFTPSFGAVNSVVKSP